MGIVVAIIAFINTAIVRYKVWKFPTILVDDGDYEGITCLQMIFKYYGKSIVEPTFLVEGKSNLLGISVMAEELGMDNLAVNISYKQLEKEVQLPVIVHFPFERLVVVYHISTEKVRLVDPFEGKLTYRRNDFIKKWKIEEDKPTASGIVLLLEPKPSFNK